MLNKNHVIGGEPDRPLPKERPFLCDDALRNGTHQGKHGYFIRVLLPSYRALPLSCIEKFELTIDGMPVDSNMITFILDGYSHKIPELGGLSKIYWWILDYADLFVESAQPLSAGEHRVQGTLVIVEPYMTVGRFPFYYTAEKRLSVAADAWEVTA
jgi:hypothetical protein